MKGFKKCPKGHFYKDDLTQCPHCQGKGNTSGNNTATIVGDGNMKTQVIPEFDGDDSNKTIIVGEKNQPKSLNRKVSMISNNKTVFEDEFEEETEGGSVVVKKERRSDRRLVGWLVTFSIDPLGIDYKLYEGRNEIGQGVDCNITVNDKTMSRRHATILFRADKYKIKDELSSHGTFVNEKDIEEETVELYDGDIIKMGETMFKFKTAF
ncbi:MAG: FHA domain-containing protein [Bacteroidales bacterium]|nr:FHA domain-containing protein [Bacteroidales bacterium]